jgi:omega-6 fatty acid desaturase (delta-12 desaturase)
MGPNDHRSILQLTGTAAAFFICWIAAYQAAEVSYLLVLALAVPAAGFLVRLFMIQHDCGHGSYLSSRRAQDFVGRCIGILTLTPYHYWRRTHAHHHAHSGDLDLRGFGDVETLTVREYLALPRRRQLWYRFYRNPATLLLLGPLFHFVLKHRYPSEVPREWKQAWASIWWTNAILAGVLILSAFTIGLGRFLMVQAPITLLAGSAGILLFYVQHQYEETYWHTKPDWDFFEAEVHGSSHLALPAPLQWLTASIGIHHVHHLSSRIPNYRLQECLDANPDLQRATRITPRDMARLFRLALWDEEGRRMIGFRELRNGKGILAPRGQS